MADAEMGSVKSGARILDLIELVASHEGPVTLAEVVAELGIPKSSALMLLRTLVAKHYVERDAEGRYQLDRLYRGTAGDWVGGRAALLRRLARSVMEELALAVQETVVVGMLTPSFEIRVIEKVRSPREVRYDVEIGSPAPAYCTAIGRAILSALPEPVVEHYLRTASLTAFTPATVTDPDALRTIVARVRQQGYALNIEEHVSGASSVATPLRDARGEVIGALNIGCVTAHFTSNREEITRRLLAAAARLNERLGHRGESAALQEAQPRERAARARRQS